MVNPKYWSQYSSNTNQITNISTKKPSDTIISYLEGPTMSDCYSTMQIALSYTIIYKIGKSTFDGKYNIIACGEFESNYIDQFYKYYDQKINIKDLQHGDHIFIESFSTTRKKNSLVSLWMASIVY